mgnify:CR=1 FL=1
MKSLECEHLVVGAGLLGLATADHLLRRGATGVLVVERAGSTNGGRPGEVGALVRQGGLDHDALEERGRLLLAAGEEYLDVDYLREGAGYRRVGSLRIPSEDALPFESERLTVTQLEERYPELVTGEQGARFFAEDGTLDTLPLLSAFYSRVRGQSARFLFDAELGDFDEQGETVRFTAGGRSGSASRVYLTAGAENLRMLPALGCRHEWCLEQVHSFRITTPTTSGPVIWLPERRTLLLPLDEREWEVEVAVDGRLGVEAAVDWTLLEAMRREEGARFPWLLESEVKRARVLPRLAFDATDPVLVSRGGRIAVAGAFGTHGLGLFPAVAECLAARGLAPLAESGGLLEEGL